MIKADLIATLLNMRPGDRVDTEGGSVVCLSGNMYAFCGETFGVLGLCREVVGGEGQ